MEDLAMYCTPAGANVQIEQFIKARGRVKSDKYEVGAFLIENGVICGRLSEFDDTTAFLNSLTSDYTYTKNDLKRIEPLIIADIEQSTSRRFILDEKTSHL
ncbi:hypothetical protein [Weissella confusa]|uniref:Uncharacterized protein n=1 Tax=Weissella confusa TaxID=1583 RepID=A0A4Z0RYN9_WEICO|nr:hypothetical protein [Weissella confusa]TGE75330.1 hypothetical protein C6P11_02065 [Weissella confusa]